jgi:prefoldin subunit 5|tara:strand:- start:1632 stop:1832 length:201 start_codon:yes stop_codon:yes gene_type:complete
MKDPNTEKIKETVANLIELASQAKGFQERLDELSDHINTIEMMLDEIGKEFDEQMEFLNTLKELKK